MGRKMANTVTVHILDRDITRRAAVSRTVMGLGMHAEVYEDVGELAARPPRSGIVMVHDDKNGSPLSEVMTAAERRGDYLPVTMYASEIDPERIVAAMQSGALDYLYWPSGADRFRRSLERVWSLDQAAAARRRKDDQARQLVSTLSPRELEVLRELVDGASNKDMALILGISPRTVEIHRGNAMRKLNASSTADAVRIGLFAGLAR
jgi:FixJ family two-component response regulator